MIKVGVLPDLFDWERKEGNQVVNDLSNKIYPTHGISFWFLAGIILQSESEVSAHL